MSVGHQNSYYDPSTDEVIFVGATGLQGITGPLGFGEGATGLQGPQGVTGLDGAAAAVGATGIQGATGVQGQTGAGIQGATGVQGVQGTQGDTGVQGDQGDTGVQGIQGQTGLQGAQGDQGATGVQGLQGQTGTQGIQGDQGDTGVQGIQGQTGLQGAAGNDGNDGAQGTTGVQGIQGDQGATGIQGVTGAEPPNQGETGVQGIQGQTGVQGVTGLTGPVSDLQGAYDGGQTIEQATLDTAIAISQTDSGASNNVLEVQNSGTGVGVNITQDGEADGVVITQNATTNLKDALVIDVTATTGNGSGILVTNYSPGAGISVTSPAETSGYGIIVAQGENALAGIGIYADNSPCLELIADRHKLIQLDVTTGSSQTLIDLNCPSGQTGKVFVIDNAGSGVTFDINKTHTGSNKVIDILNSGTGDALFIDQNGNGVAISIDSEATGEPLIELAPLNANTRGDIAFGTGRTADPASPSEGDVWYNATDNTWYGYDGTANQDLVSGIQGATGIQGVTGLQGTQGDAGSQGDAGIQGVTGLQGTQGDQGATGVQGVTGVTAGNTLDQAYDEGGAGAGRTITADTGAVQLDVGATTSGLDINQTNTGSSSIVLDVENSGTGAAVNIAQDGVASALLVTQNAAARAIEVVKAAGGSGYAVDVDDGGDDGGLRIQKTAGDGLVLDVLASSASGTSVATRFETERPLGTAIAVIKSGTGSGDAMTISNAGTGDALLLTQAGNGTTIDLIDNGASSNITIDIDKTSTNASGNVIDIQNAGTGKDIEGTDDSWNVTPGGRALFNDVTQTEQSITLDAADTTKTIDIASGNSVVITANNTASCDVDTLSNMNNGQEATVLLVQSTDGSNDVTFSMVDTWVTDEPDTSSDAADSERLIKLSKRNGSVYGEDKTEVATSTAATTLLGIWTVGDIDQNETNLGSQVGNSGLLDTHDFIYLRAPYAGSIVACSVHLQDGNARTAGTLTIRPQVNDVDQTALNVVLDGTNTTNNSATASAGTSTFSAGDLISIEAVSDATWEPDNVYAAVQVWVTFS